MPEKFDSVVRGVDSSVMAKCQTVEWLFNELNAVPDQLIILDTRSQKEYNRSHILGGLNITLPSLMLRRLKKGNIRFRSLINSEEGKERFEKISQTGNVVLYDEETTELNENLNSPLQTLLDKLKKDGCRAYVLKGGFRKFQWVYPELCEGIVDSSDDEVSSGIGSLSINDSCDMESDAPVDYSLPVEILPHLFLGSAKDSKNIENLSKYGIKYILNVTPNLPNVFENDGRFKYMKIPINDHWSQNLSVFFPEAIEFIDEARRSKCGILVHCLAGVSRSVTVTVAYLMQKLSLSLNDAYDFVKKKKSNISPNFNFMGQLLDFERTLSSSPCRKGTCTCALEGRRCLSPTCSQFSSDSSPGLHSAGSDAEFELV